MSDFPLHTIDLVIIAAYFAVVLGIGAWVAQRTESGEDLFLAGRSLAWGTVGLSLFASNVSSTTLIGLAGDAYRTGLSIANYEWMAALILVFAAVFFVPFFLRSRVTTMPEFLEKRFDKRLRRYFSAITIFLSLVVDAAASLYAGTLVLQTFVPGLSTFWTCVALALVAGLYTAAGGLAAVVYSDMLQAVILIFGTTFLAVSAFSEFGFSWSQATAALPEGHLSMIKPLGDPTLPWLGTITGVPILGFYYWVTNQYVIQRVLGARSLEDGRWGALLGGALKLTPVFIMVLPGAFAYTLFPDLGNADQVFPTMVAELLPVGMTGLVLAGLVAAIMSSVDSILNSASTLVTVDFILPSRPDLSPKQVGRIGRWVTGLFMLVAALWAPAIGQFGGLFSYLQQVLSYFTPPIAATFLVGMFWARGNAVGAFYTFVGGHLLGAVAFVLGPIFGLIDIHFTILAGILFAASAVIFILVSLQTAPPPAEKTRGLTWSQRIAEPAGAPSLLRDYRVYAGGVLAATVAIVITFW